MYLLTTATSRSLPTRSPIVAKYMIGLKKAKAKAGEYSHSMKAMTAILLEAIWKNCVMNDDLTPAQFRRGVMHYVSSCYTSPARCVHAADADDG